jgi:predicted transcriptional regulator
MVHDGRLPPAILERRTTKKGRHTKTMVVSRAAVLAYIAKTRAGLNGKVEELEKRAKLAETNAQDAGGAAPKKAKKYVHWMQRPKNRAKMLARVKVMQRAAAEKRKQAAAAKS